MDTVDEYVNSYADEKREWLTTMVTFMRENFPELEEKISYQIPTFKYKGGYIAFSVAKEHFTFHTVDFEMIEELKQRLPRAKFGRGSAKIKYADTDTIPVLFEMSRKIVDRGKANTQTG